MKKIQNKAFTLVELLVVITILAIISVVAYQNFGGAVDKAIAWRKISDVSTIETSLQQYKVDKWSYPAVGTGWTSSSTNKWWYDNWVEADPSNQINVSYNWEAISTIDSAKWGWKVYWINWYSSKQIGAKWTIWRAQLWKKYLSKDLYDPELWDIKVWTDKFIKFWIGRYVYAVYKKPKSNDWWTSNYNWTNYNIAFTVRKKWSDSYLTKIVWDYDEESCFDNKANCPKTLIWSKDKILIDWQEQWKKSDWTDLASFKSTDTNQWIPYPVNDFE